MEPVRFPRLILILWLSIVVVALLSGIARAFTTVRAASSATATPAGISLTETETPLLQTETASAESDQEEYPPPNQSSATDGITALVIILVAVILLGVIWGQRTLSRTRKRGKK